MIGAGDYSSLEFSEVSSHYESSIDEDEEKEGDEGDKKVEEKKSDEQNE